MSTVFVVVDLDDYEGHGAPLAVFATEKEAADFMFEVANDEKPPDEIWVLAMDLGQKPTLPVISGSGKVVRKVRPDSASAA